MTELLAPVGVALTTGAPIDEVLDQVDLAIEQAVAAGDASTLNELAATLDATARQRDGTWSGLAIAAARARATAARLGTEPARPDVIPAPVPLAPARTPVEVQPATTTNAGWWRRLGALAMDLFGVLMALSILEAVVGGAGDGVALAYLVVSIGYFAGFYAFYGGATIGMTILGIAVRNRDGEPIGLGRATLRTLVLFTLLMTGIGAIVDAIVAAVTPGRSLHDAIVGTVVIRTQRLPSRA